MKKYIAIVVTIVVVISITLGLIIYNQNNKFMDDEIKSLKEDLVRVNQYLNSHDYPNTGVVEVSAKYKGAHGENYPRDFVYNFELLNNEINFSNEFGYSNLEYGNEITNILNKFMNISDNDIKNIPVTIHNKRVIVDTNYINTLLGTNYKDIEVTFKAKGIFGDISSKIITIDKTSIEIKDNEILIESEDNKITISISEIGYSLNINDILKMNAFFYDEKNSYSVIINNYVFYLEYYEDKMIIKASSEASIYNGMDLTVKFVDAEVDLSKVDEENNNPIIRYLDNVNLEYWR